MCDLFLKELYKNKISYSKRRSISRQVFRGLKKEKIYKNFILDKDYLFIHVPKAAGKSIALAVYGDDKPGHYSVKDYIFYDREKFERSFKFTFVRNPIDRFVSAYQFLQSGGTSKGDKIFKENIIDQYATPDEFVDKWVTSKNIWYKEHFVPQYYFLEYEQVICVDFIGHFENLAKDFEFIREKAHIKNKLVHKNKSKGVRPLFNEKSLEKIRNIYKEDFIKLGYK